jgi:RNA polymerase sigma-70 factor (ECF subfamily)
VDDTADRELVERMLSRDEAAFDEFFADYFPRLFRVALGRLRDEDLAEEVVQAAMVQAVRKLDTWRGEAALFTWLCTICRREIGASLGRATRRQQVVLADDDPDVRAALESLGAAMEGPDRQVDRDDVGRLVQAALDYLPPRYSRVLEWKYLDEVSVREIATRLGTTPKAVESLLTRAREAFREGFGALQMRVKEG